MSDSEDEPKPFAVIAQPLGMYAGELLARSREYLEAAKAVAEAHPHPSSLVHPKYYLLAHSVELSLKAFLAAKGETKRRLRKLGHVLPDLVTAAAGRGLAEIEHFDVLVGHLWTINENYSLRYPEGYILSILRFDQAAAIAATLLDVTTSAVWPVHLKDRMRYLSNYKDKYVEWLD